MVFFDAGETILRPHPSFVELFAAICRSEGRDVAPQSVSEVRERLAPHLIDLAEEEGTGKTHKAPLAAGTSGSAEDSRAFWIHLYRRFLQELGIEEDELAERLYAKFSSSSSYKLYDDVLVTLDELRDDGYRLGLISNFERWLEEMLVELEVGDLFETAVISGIDGVEKPDPAIYRLALDRAGVAPERAVHVGDSLDMDVRPAGSVGMSTVLLDRAGRYDATLLPTASSPQGQLDAAQEGRTATISSLRELPRVVREL
jgi:putative hydrolase of the HAD superfamily